LVGNKLTDFLPHNHNLSEQWYQRRDCPISTQLSTYVSHDLHEILLMLRDDYPDSWIYEMHPSLLIDFDNQILNNYYYEPAAFEEYAPDGRKGTY